MANIIAIAGPTCSGKSTLAKFLGKYGYKTIVTYTTRPPRPGERDGVDYYFITEEEFNQKEEKGFFAETAEYDATFGHCHYGSAVEDYLTDEKRVIVLNPHGIKAVSEHVFTVYLMATNSAIFSRGYARGDSTQELNRRIAGDMADYKLIQDGGYIDFLIEGDWPLEVLAQWILEALGQV